MVLNLNFYKFLFSIYSASFYLILDSSFGTMPSVWEFQYNTTQPRFFVNHTEEFAIPHSEYVQPCHQCCPARSSSCGHCGGNNKLKYFLRCRIIWFNHRESYFTEPSLIPR